MAINSLKNNNIPFYSQMVSGDWGRLLYTIQGEF